MAASVLKIAVSVVAVGVAVMIITVSVVTGFKHGVYKKIIGFQAHITVKNRDINETYETLPISKNQSFYPGITKINGINHIQIYATKPGFSNIFNARARKILRIGKILSILRCLTSMLRPVRLLRCKPI